MARQTNVLRLPVPPTLTSKLEPENAKMLNEHLQNMTTILNQALQSFQNRLNTVQQTGASAPPPVSNVAVVGKQGLFHITWNRIKNADGYVIVQAADSAMKQIIGRYNIPDGQSVSHQIPVGNTAVTGSFQVYAYQGPKVGNPSNIITGTTLTYTTSEAAPTTSNTPPQPPLIAPVRSGPNLP